MRNGLRFLIAAALLAAPAPAHAQLGDVSPIGFKAPDTPYIETSSSSATHPPALILRRTVHYADVRGGWHRFALAADAQEVRLARLEDGGGMAVWDDGDTLLTRTWTRDGVLAPARAVMSRGFMGFEIAHDEAGTVVIATAGERMGVIVRSPGGAWTVPQDIGPAAEATPETFSAVVADGAVSVSWEGRRAVRTGPAPAFEPAAPVPADPAVLVADGSKRVRVSASVRKLCAKGCEAVRLFTWPDGTARLLLNTAWEWFVAQPQADGTFAAPTLATHLGGHPLWTERPGVVAFTRETLPGLGLVPYGVAPRRGASVRLVSAFTDGRRLYVNVFCSTTCRLSGLGSRVSTLPLGQPLGKRALEPYEVVQIVRPKPRGTRVRIPYTLRDARGRAIRRVLTLRRGTRQVEDRREWVLAARR